ncbi:MAG TPA: acyltransferase [Chitinophagaceae bacterium]|nr:acyltransferase [Chitinophagaceae bacterium]
MKHRFEVLDIFRGIFASMVVFFHMSAFANTVILNNNLVYNSDLFVDFFFVLSGFVITYTHQHMSQALDMGLFYKKRFFRLYPLHFIMLLVFVAIESVKHFFVGHIQINQLDNANNNVLTFFSNLFLIHSVKLPGVTDVSWNIPSWSISAEMLCYLLFGVIVWFIHKVHIYKSRNFVYGLTAITALLIYYGIRSNFNLERTFDYGFLRAWIGFFTGAVCFNIFSSTREKVIAFSSSFFHVSEVFLLAAMVIMVYNGDYLKPYAFVYEILFFCSIYIFAFEKGLISKLFKKSGLLQKIGTYSYSIYMVHAFLLSIFNIIFIRLLKLPPAAYSYLFILNYMLIYFVSQWTYKHIELRFQLKKKKGMVKV